MNNQLLRLLSLLMAFGLVAAACGGSSDDASSGSSDGDTTTAEDTESDGDAMDDDADDGDAMDGDAMDDDADDGDAMADDAMADGVSLVDICPSPLVVQTDWFPEAEHGALYNLIGEGYSVDTNNKVVSGPMVAGGHETGIDFEVRTGGPAIGFAPVASYVYTDDGIHLAYQNTESQALAFGDAPMLSVVAPLEINPQMIMWDPDSYPDVSTLADLGEQNITINVFGGGVFSQVFEAQGVWSSAQIDPSYDGSPARFIADGGATAQQGFASAEPFEYEFNFDEWGKPVAFQLLHDAGFEVYAATIAIRPDDKESLDACLKQVVPMIQQSQVDFINAPDRANAIIIDAVAQFADFWVYEQGVADFSVGVQRDLGLVGNGDNSTLGDMSGDRIQGVIDSISEAGLDTGEVTAEDIFTNEYIDDSIGL